MRVHKIDTPSDRHAHRARRPSPSSAARRVSARHSHDGRAQLAMAVCAVPILAVLVIVVLAVV